MIYTLIHRFGLAAQNLRDGHPGGGYVPFLHFAAMAGGGLLKVVERGQRLLLDFAAYDSAAVLNAAINAAVVVDREINSHDASHQPDRSAEAMLEYAVARLTRRELAESFSRVMRR